MYVSHKCMDDPTYSKIKLFKILFFSDFESFGIYARPSPACPTENCHSDRARRIFLVSRRK